MRARDFWRAVTVDRTNLLDAVLQVLAATGARYCVIGGVAVNAYVEPVVTLDVDLVVAAADEHGVELELASRFTVERFPHSVNVSGEGSDLRIQLQTDPRYAPFVERAERRDVLGTTLLVATLEDVLQGKVWAARDPGRRASKRQKDLADIARIIEREPGLRAHVPEDVLARLIG
jgi:hypothetical protein